MIHTPDDECTKRRSKTPRALRKLTVMSTGRRLTRSTSIPASGEKSAAKTPKKNVRPAAALECVSSFVQMPSARNIEVSPKREKLCPVRYTRASRDDISCRIVIVYLQ